MNFYDLRVMKKTDLLPIKLYLNRKFGKECWAYSKVVNGDSDYVHVHEFVMDSDEFDELAKFLDTNRISYQARCNGDSL